MINPCDRISLGWQVWLTPRQTQIIYDALCAVGGDERHAKLVEWFGTEIETHAQVRGRLTDE